MLDQGFKWKARYSALALLFSAWMICYIDRMVIATALPYIARELKLSPVAMGGVLSAFFFGYATFQIPGGILSDRFGARKVMVTALTWWGVFTAITGMVSSLATMIWVRVAFGLGEGVFPSATWKAIANWFPSKERGMATALMLSSNTLGPAFAPLLVTAIIGNWGWRMVFYVMFFPGILAAIWMWRSLPDDPAAKKGVSSQEVAEIRQDLFLATDVSKTSFWEIIRVRAVWQSFFILLFYNMTMWGFMSWLPSYLVKVRSLELMKLGVVTSLPFFAGGLGHVVGGWLSDHPFKNKRKIPLIACQWIGVVFLYLMYTAKSLPELIVVQTVGGFFLFCASAILWTLPMSVIAKTITGRAMGFINTAGQLAGLVSPLIVGLLIQEAGGNFNSAFIFLGCTAIASSMVAISMPQRKPVTVLQKEEQYV